MEIARATRNTTTATGLVKPSESPRAVAQTASNTAEPIRMAHAVFELMAEKSGLFITPPP